MAKTPETTETTEPSKSPRGAGERISQLKSAAEDARSAERIPETPQTLAPTYRLAFEDPEFLRSDERRGLRLALELEKPEQVLRARGVKSTVIMFGSARIPAPDAAVAAATAKARRNLEAASKYYAEAEKFARIVSEYSKHTYGREFVIVTGGGPGIMEAGNKGAASVGAFSIGLNIVLPHEQAPNPFVSPELCFNFHYFAIRKMHFLMRARAITFFPGGFGTLDELFEALTLIQTGRMRPVPILLFGERFWRGVVNFEALCDAGTIAPEDLELFEFVENAEDAWAKIRARYLLDEPAI